MSTKNGHVVAFWVKKAKTVGRQIGRCPTAGQVAEYVGQSRSTAKKYLEMAVGEGWLHHVQGTHVNGQTMTCYGWKQENS